MANTLLEALIAAEENPPPKGDRGVQGEKGDKGDQGNRGLPGDKGDKGDKGDQGRDGLDGKDGKEGKRGPKGEKGDDGEKGEKGDQGPPGGIAGRSGGYNLRGLASGMVIDDEGTALNGGTVIGEIDYQGAGVSVAQVGAKAVVTIPGGGGPTTTPTIEEVLTEGDDAGGQEITNLTLVEVDQTADVNFNDAILIRVPDPSTLGGNGYVFRVYDPVNNLILADLDAYGSFAIFGVALGGNVGGVDVYNTLSQSIFRAHTDGEVKFPGFSVYPAFPGRLFFTAWPLFAGAASAPPDGDLSASNFTIWLDDTNGAAEFEIKGKTADGTVVAQSFPIGVTPQTYTESNVTTDRSFNANATSIDELADVLGTLIADLRARKIVA